MKNINLKQIISVLSLTGCGFFSDSNPDKKEPEDTNLIQSQWGQCIPKGANLTIPETATEYAEICKPFIGVAPTINCGEGVVIPIKVNGKEVFEDQADGFCDHSDFKRGCGVGSRIGRLIGKSEDGSPLPHVVWVYFCRKQGVGSLDEGKASVQMIGHNKETGATCFFEAPDAIGKSTHLQFLSEDENGFITGQLPGPDSQKFNEAFIPPPPGVQCTSCHQNDPFIHDPFIDGARLPEDSSQPVVPELASANSKYFVVGGANWDMRTVHIEGNKCIACHKFGQGTAEILEFSVAMDVNEFMPLNNPGTASSDYEALKKCFKNGPENTPNCDFVVPPAGECEGGIAHDQSIEKKGKTKENSHQNTQK